MHRMKNLKKYYVIPIPPNQLYQALTNPFTIELWSGGDAVMQAVADTEFSLWDGSIVGKNLAFDTDKMIQQQWYFGEQETPSVVTIKLHADKKGTSVELLHTNIPDEAFEDMIEGWDNSYFGSLLAFYQE